MNQKYSKSLKTGALTLFLISSLSTLASAVTSVPEANDTPIVPHRAVYELSLKNSQSSANIADANGRMVFELSGSKCEGYLVNMRFILTVADTKGGTNLTDVRTSSWEGGNAERFRFNTSQYLNNKLSKTTIGEAARVEKSTDISVNIKSPKRIKSTFTDRPYFPTEHTKLMLDAAISGKKILNAPIYDGSEDGNTLYDTTAIIGNPLAVDETVITSKVKNLEIMKNMVSWPVAISFFNTNKSTKQDLLPDYEISFRLYQNGVSRQLLIDYGDFALDGNLKEIEFLPEAACK